MAEQFSEKVEILDSASNVTIWFNGNSGAIIAGGGGKDGDLILRDGAETQRIWMDGGTGNVLIKNAAGKFILRVDGNEGDITVYREINGTQRPVMAFDASQARLYLGSEGNAGEIYIRGDAGTNPIRLKGGSARLDIGGSGHGGTIGVWNDTGRQTFKVDGNEGDITVYHEIAGAPRPVLFFDASSAALYLGSKGQAGDIFVRDVNGKTVFHVRGTSGQIRLNDSNGKLRVDVRGTSGQIFLRDSDGDARAFMGGDGKIRLWDSSQNERTFISGYGQVILKDSDKKTRVDVTGSDGRIRLKDSNGKLRVDVRGTSGQVFLRDSDGDARAFMGGDGKIRLWDSSQNERITIDSDTGDIVLRNADCAEEFDIANDEQVDPGTVMVFDGEGRLQQSTEAYDRKVAGVIAGAGGFKPGIVLDKQSSQSERLPLALMGKVYCKVDAGYASVEVGDLLTTSPTPGHVMKAEDPLKAFGAVIGKALRPLKEGKQLIPILVALQ